MFKLALFSIAIFLMAPAASADGICQGKTPAAGAIIHGPVLEIPNGGSLCLATGSAPETWIRVSVAHFNSSRPNLMAAAFGKNATCVIGRNGEAECAVEGQSLASTLQQPQVIRAATEWR